MALHARHGALYQTPPAGGGGGGFIAAWANGSNAILGGSMKKNVSGQKIGVQMVSASDGSAFTGSVTVSVTVDAGTQATGSVGSGACTHEGNGYHTYAPAQAETNGDLLAFTFTGTGAVPVTVQAYTSFPQTVDNATGIADIQSRIPAALSSGNMKVDVLAMSGSTTAADNLETAALAYSTTRGLAGTALPAAAADAAGGLPISDAGGLDLDTLLARVTGTLSGTHTAGQADLGTNKPGTDDQVIGMTLWNRTRNEARYIYDYTASSGRALLSPAQALTWQDGDLWELIPSPPAPTEATALPEVVLTSAYDAAKTAAQAGDQMDLVDAPNATAVTAIKSGLATASALSTADGKLDVIQERTDNLPDDPADESLIIAATDAIVAILGALNTSASSGDVGTTTTIVAYLKQIINTIEGSPGIPTWPSGAAPGNAVSIAEALRHLYTQVGTAGVGLTEAGGTGDQFTAIPWNAAWDAEVQSEVEDALTAARSESSGVPAANASLVDKVRWLATIARNKVTNDGTDQKVYADDATTVIGTASVGESGGTVTRGEYA